MTEDQHVHQAERGVQRFSIRDNLDWMQYSGTALADVVNDDEMPGVKLGGVGFARAAQGATTNFEFAYDEVLVVTKGKCTVGSEIEIVTAEVGEVIYLPAGMSGSFHADEDTELVYVASPPYGTVNRDAKASLLTRSPAPR